MLKVIKIMSYYFFRLPFLILLKLMFRLKVDGIANLPRYGGAILAANHSSFLDPVAIGCAVPRPVHWLVQKPVYRVWWLRLFFALTGMVTTNGGLNHCVSLLKKGEVIGIFPEGRRSQDGRLGTAEDGVAIMALQSEAPVIPCAILGAFEAYPPNRMFPRPGQITVRLGETMYFRKLEEEIPDEERLWTTTATIMQKIEELMG